MCIYCNTTNYRKIYENHLGTIPKDHEGRSYEIHQLDITEIVVLSHRFQFSDNTHLTNLHEPQQAMNRKLSDFF